MPLFYITFLLAVPVTLFGYGSFDPSNRDELTGSIIQNLIPTYTWTLFIFGSPFNGPGWTVCTLWFFWIVFPWLQAYYEYQSDAELIRTIVRCYWVQLAICLVGFPVAAVATGSTEAAFWWSTGVPYSRLPVFIMGMCAGNLCTRHAQADTMPWFRHSGTFIPWDFWCTCSCPGMLFCGDDNPCLQLFGYRLISTEINFVHVCFKQASLLLMSTVALSMLCSAWADVGSNWWFQAVNVFAQLDLLVALTRARGASFCSVVLRAPLIQWFGELSMAIYLVHFPLLLYVCFMAHGRGVDWPPSMYCDSYATEGSEERTTCVAKYDEWVSARTLPLWGIVVVPAVSVLAAAALYYGVEEPVRKYLK
jgi:peptidoglycan/LPS O-acetylase OafA/YrhL